MNSVCSTCVTSSQCANNDRCQHELNQQARDAVANLGTYPMEVGRLDGFRIIAQPSITPPSGVKPCAGCINPSECVPHGACAKSRMHGPTPTGWLCPKCGAVHAPFVRRCDSCMPKVDHSKGAHA